jgi:hypothetical protein
MRALRLALPPLLVATSLAAQSPTSGSSSAPATATPGWSAFFDPAALLDGRLRLGVEALMFDRWTLAVAASHTRSSSVALDSGYTCDLYGWDCGKTYRGTSSRFSGGSVEAAARYHPAALSFNRARSAVGVYVGAFVGYYWSADDRSANSVRTGGSLRPQPFPDRPIPFPHLPEPTLVSVPAARRASTWDGGAEIGVRLVARAPVFVDVSGYFTWATIGRWTSRFAAAVGVGW